MGHVSGPLAVPEHLYTAAPQGVRTRSSHFLQGNGDPVGLRLPFGSTSQVIGVAVFFALLLKPVALEETEEIEQVFLGKKASEAALVKEVVQPHEVMRVLPSEL